jgi:hypothetical protein
MIKSLINSIAFFVLVAVLSSCAASYKPVNPAGLNYPSLEAGNNFSYQYNVLRNAGNKRLANKEDKKGIRIVALKIVNTSAQTIKYGEHFKLYSGSSEVNPLPTPVVLQSIKQTVPTYLLYMLFTPLKLFTSDGEEVKVTPIGYVIGPALTLINVGISADANSKFKSELEFKSIINREIKAGETFHGLIAIYDNGFVPLTMKMKESL